VASGEMRDDRRAMSDVQLLGSVLASRDGGNPRRPEPHSGHKVGQIQQDVVLTRCFGCPLSYLKRTIVAGCSMFLPHFLPHPYPFGFINSWKGG
jgi:hypothetical protein